MKKAGVLTVLVSMSFMLSAQNTFTDDRDHKTYKSIQLGTQTWMAENLAFDTAYSYCYNDDGSMCSRYGRLYEWEIAMKACPKGWHLPTLNEWDSLVSFLGGAEVAGGKITTWASSGFKGQFAGRRLANGAYYYKGSYGFFWTATETDQDKSKTVTLKAGIQSLPINDYDKYSAYSVRCVKN